MSMNVMDDCLPSGGAGPQSGLPPRPSATVASRVTALILVFAALYFARAFFIPVAIALLLSFLFGPAVRRLARWRIPPAAGAGLVLSVAATGCAIAAYELSAPIDHLIATAPAATRTAARKWRALAVPIEQIASVADEIADAARVERVHAPPSTVVVQGPSVSSRVFGTTEVLVASTVEVIVLLYSLLAVGDVLLLRVVHAIPQCRDRERIIGIARAAQRSVSAYLILTAVINVSEGLLVAGALAAIGMPTPLLWGTLVAVAEFIPYIGMFAMLGVLAIAGVTAFPSLPHALLAPAAYLAINFVQGNIVTPIVMSRRLTLNPVAIFISLGLWWWLWGIAGAFLSVPMLAGFKIVCDHVDALAPLGALVGDARDVEDRTAGVQPAPALRAERVVP